MAEFMEVMRQARRLCAAHGGMCNYRNCPLDNGKECRLNIDLDSENYNELECIIMDWAKENPEIVYPTWKKWQNSMFPNADVNIRPCWFIPKNPIECSTFANCSGCIDQPIPAEIAKKLGIKPIGGNRILHPPHGSKGEDA